MLLNACIAADVYEIYAVRALHSSDEFSLELLSNLFPIECI